MGTAEFKRRTVPGVVSMGVRLPGGVETPRDLWALLVASRDAVSDDVPSNRPHHGRPGGYLDASTLFGFDRRAFNVSRAEACAADPQQRLFLECCGEALEAAHRKATPGSNGANVGVFAARLAERRSCPSVLHFCDVLQEDDACIPTLQK